MASVDIAKNPTHGGNKLPRNSGSRVLPSEDRLSGTITGRVEMVDQG